MNTNVKEIATGVYWASFALANVYFVRNETNWVLIDTGRTSSGEKITQIAYELFGIHNKPVAIYLTHGHSDHRGSALELAQQWNVPIYIHSSEVEYVNGNRIYPDGDRTVGGFLAFLDRYMQPSQRGYIDLGDPLKIYPVHSLPELPEWELIFTPGHSPGHVSFFRKSDATLIAGDACATMDVDSFLGVLIRKQQLCGPNRPYTINWEVAHQSIKRLADLQPSTIACGHGKPISHHATQQIRTLADTFSPPKKGYYVNHPIHIKGM